MPFATIAEVLPKALKVFRCVVLVDLQRIVSYGSFQREGSHLISKVSINVCAVLIHVAT